LLLFFVFSYSERKRHFSSFHCDAENLRDAHGRYTQSTITRAGKLVGAFGATLDAAYQHNVCDTEADDSYRSKFDYRKDVKSFCAEYKKDCLFDSVPGRHHSAFPSFQADIVVDKSEKLKERLVQYSRKLDMTRPMHNMY